MKFPLSILALICVSLFAVAQPAVAADDMSGVRQIEVHSQERGQDIPVIVWYPASSGGRAITVGETAFFIGTHAILDAPVAHGSYPLILLSHGVGLGGTPQAASWIAAPLAKRGFIVAAPLHLGNGGATRSAAETMKLLLRPSDITATLDALENSRS